MTQLTIEDLTRIGENFLIEEYGIYLDIPIRRNNRLKRSMGRYIETYNEDNKLIPNRIEISGDMFEYGADSAIISTLKHELVHYALAVNGEPNDDGHPHFEAELKRVGASATKSVSVGKIVIFRCEKCGKVGGGSGKQFVENATKTLKYYRTKCCRGEMTYLDTVTADGTKSVDELIAEGEYV